MFDGFIYPVILVVLLASSCIVTATAAPMQSANENRRELAQSDQDRAREEKLEGRILSYAEIKKRAHVVVPGRVVGQELRRVSREQWVYRLKVLQRGGKVALIVMDAHTGRVLAVRGKV